MTSCLTPSQSVLVLSVPSCFLLSWWGRCQCLPQAPGSCVTSVLSLAFEGGKGLPFLSVLCGLVCIGNELSSALRLPPRECVQESSLFISYVLFVSPSQSRASGSLPSSRAFLPPRKLWVSFENTVCQRNGYTKCYYKRGEKHTGNGCIQYVGNCMDEGSPWRSAA